MGEEHICRAHPQLDVSHGALRVLAHRCCKSPSSESSLILLSVFVNGIDIGLLLSES
jgi:hypothetical protein